MINHAFKYTAGHGAHDTWVGSMENFALIDTVCAGSLDDPSESVNASGVHWGFDSRASLGVLPSPRPPDGPFQRRCGFVSSPLSCSRNKRSLYPSPRRAKRELPPATRLAKEMRFSSPRAQGRSWYTKFFGTSDLPRRKTARSKPQQIYSMVLMFLPSSSLE